jgi:energy-coupling factor transporter transmembrane protein EcfT
MKNLQTHPTVRILGGVGMLATVAMTPPSTAALCVVPFLALYAPGWRRLGQAFLFALAMFAPLAACAPFIADDPLIPLVMAWRGTLGVLVSVATCSAVEVGELRRGLCFLPRPLAALVLQIVLQTVLLAGEVRRISHALLLRGGGMRALFAFPVVWLSRLLVRAERIGDAMEVRGFE